MLPFPSQPMSLMQVIKHILAYYPRILKDVFWLIVLSASVHLIVPVVFLLNDTMGWVFLIGSVLVTWYMFGAILYRSDAMLKGKFVSFAEAFQVSRTRYLAILFGNVIFFGIIAVSLLVEFSLGSLLEFVHLNNVSLMISVIFDALIYALIYFVIPVIVLDGVGVFCAFQQSARLVWHSWWRAFIVMFGVLLVILGLFAFGILITGWNRIYLFTVYDFVFQIVAYPLIIASTLVMLNDLKLRFAQKKPIGHSAAGHH